MSPLGFFSRKMAEIFLDDLLSRREKGTVASRFLNEAELALTCKELERRHEDHLVYGGYADAVRAKIVLPAYWEAEDIDCSRYVVSVKISGSSYSRLSHSDFLGSLMGLGISRDFIGDIVVSDDNTSSVLFCDPSIKAFLLSDPSPLERVGREKVRTEEYTPDTYFSAGNRYEDLCCFVSSMRLDCVVAALCGTSREKSKEMILSGGVVLNYVQEDSADRSVACKDVLSIRGKGKFRIDTFAGMTKKGRIRLNVFKYI